MATSIYAFNTSPLGVSVYIRNSTTAYTFSAAGSSSTPAWSPTTPNTAIPFGGTSPSSGQLGFGQNACILNDGYSTSPFTVTIPTTVGPTTSLELYLFYTPPPNQSQAGTVGYVLLNDGLPIGGNIGGGSGS